MSDFTPCYNGGGAPATMANALKACRSDITYIKEDLKPGSRRHRAATALFDRLSWCISLDAEQEKKRETKAAT